MWWLSSFRSSSNYLACIWRPLVTGLYTLYPNAHPFLPPSKSIILSFEHILGSFPSLPSPCPLWNIFCCLLNHSNFNCEDPGQILPCPKGLFSLLWLAFIFLSLNYYGNYCVLLIGRVNDSSFIVSSIHYVFLSSSPKTMGSVTVFEPCAGKLAEIRMKIQ